MANSTSTQPEQTIELKEPEKVQSNPSIAVDQKVTMVETIPLSPVPVPIFRKQPSSISFAASPQDVNSSADGQLVVSLGSGYKETTAIISHHRNLSALSNHLNTSGFGSGNLSPSIVGIQSPERRMHRQTASLESMEVKTNMDEETCESGSSSSIQQDSLLQLVIVFDRDEEDSTQEKV